MAGRCLIVANQTLGGEALERAVRDCLSRDISQFYVVAPMTQVEHEATGWTGGFGLGETYVSEESLQATKAAMEQEARRYEAELAESRRRARHRLDRMIEKIETMGGDAEGEVGAEDPLEATRVALENQAPFDEVIVSTLPSGLSRWVKMDLPNRIERLTDVPVTTIEADS